MKIMWTKIPASVSFYESTAIVDAGTSDNIAVQPRGRFARFVSAGNFTPYAISLPSGTDISRNKQVFICAFRVPFVDRDASGDPVKFTLQISGLVGGEASISLSGAGGFADTTFESVGSLNQLTFTHFDELFTGWVTFAITVADAGGSFSASVSVFPTQGIDSFGIDFGYSQFARLWEPPNFISSSAFFVDPLDPSATQRSDGGQLFATRVDKRRSVGFDLVPREEDQFIVGTDPQNGGLMTIADQVGTTEPVMIIPSQDRAFSRSMNILGTVREWPRIEHIDNGLWEARGLIVDELL